MLLADRKNELNNIITQSYGTPLKTSQYALLPNVIVYWEKVTNLDDKVTRNM